MGKQDRKLRVNTENAINRSDTSTLSRFKVISTECEIYMLNTFTGKFNYVSKLLTKYKQVHKKFLVTFPNMKKNMFCLIVGFEVL